MKLPFVSKKFVERSAYRALFDPTDTGKRAPRWHKRERIKPRKGPDYSSIEKRVLDHYTGVDHKAEAGIIDRQEASPTGRVKREPWYKKKKLT